MKEEQEKVDEDEERGKKKVIKKGKGLLKCCIF